MPKATELREIAPVSDAFLDSLPHHYLISDVKGTVTCVSEGLWKECGLHSSFFDYSNNYQPSINLEDVFLGNLTKAEFLQAVQHPQGLEYKINSASVYNAVKLEKMS